MLKFALPAVAALGLAAFAAQSKSTYADMPSAPATIEMPAMGWHVSHEGPVAKVAYGLQNSDQLVLMFTCEPGQAQATVYGDVMPASPRSTEASMGETAIDPLGGGLLDEVLISVRDPALQGLAREGKLAVVGEAGIFDLPATRAERARIADVLSYCAKDRA